MSMSPISLAWVLSLHYAAIKGVLHARRSSITFSLTSLALVSVLIYAWCVGLGRGRWINTCRLHPIWTGKWRWRRKATQGIRVRIRTLVHWQSSENKILRQHGDSMFFGSQLFHTEALRPNISGWNTNFGFYLCRSGRDVCVVLIVLVN